MKLMIVILAMSFFHLAWSEPVELFHCRTPVFSLDQEFQQGSLTVLRIHYNPESKMAAVETWPAEGPRKILYPMANSKRAILDAQASHNSFAWIIDGELVVASMVYVGEWVIHIPFTEAARVLDPRLPEGADELICDELVDYIEYAH